MSATDDALSAHEGLKDAIASGHLTEALQKRAQNILDGIERPIRLGLLGLPKSGKSALLNLLVGDTVIPDDLPMPTVNLMYGDAPSAICTFPDGTVETIALADISDVISRSPAFIELRKPLPALKKLSMLEIVASPDPVDQKRSVQWASKRVDIALWCSDGSFDEAEQDIWDHAPDFVQDRAYLMLTKSMAPNATEALDQRMADAKASGQDFFKQILSIDAKTAISARKPDGSVDKDTLRKSGGIALITAILRDVEAGRQSSIDQAHVFLRQIDFTAIKKDKPAAKDSPELQAAPVVAETVPVAPGPVAPAPAPVVSVPVAAVPDLPMADVPTAAVPVVDVKEVRRLSVEDRETIQKAVEQLTAEGDAMIDELSAGRLDDKAIMNTCVDTVTWLADYMTQSDGANDTAFAATRETALDAADLIQLIQLETGDNVVPDALSLMVQLKQEMQTTLAA